MTWGENALKKHRGETWKPHVYQAKASEFLVNNGAAALFADPGTGKTSIVLNVVSTLLERGVARRILVIAPLRVCQLVWWQESRRWSQFRHLRFGWLHNSRAPWDIDGSPKRKDKEINRTDADIWLINPEGVQWLATKFTAKTFPFDTVVVDELTKFKRARAKRSKTLLQIAHKAPRVWGLTGSPTPNGYEDLFGQMLLLDGGNALGRYYTKFRDKYFVPDGFTGFKYVLAKNADKRIEAAIDHLVLRIAAEDWLELPKQVDHPISIKLDDKARKAYETLKKQMILDVPDGVVTAANSAALYSKLAQLANGRVYLEQEFGKKREVLEVHSAKVEALDDLVEELSGAPLLVTYEFNHDLDQIKEWHQKKFKTPLRFLGRGTKGTEADQIEKDWNANDIGVLAVHPASSGHGLNFQRGGAQHICHFSATWDYELYDQVIQRILRQGNTAAHVVNHLLLVESSIDELKYEALQDKDTTQDRFLQAINTAFQDEPTNRHSTQEKPMAFEKLKRKAAAAPAVEEAPAAAPAAAQKVAPKGWGKIAESNDEQEQRAAIQDKIRGNERAVDEPEKDEDVATPTDAKSAFSRETQAAMDGEGEEAPVEEKPKTKRKATKKKAAPAPVAVDPAAPHYSLGVTVKVVFDDEGAPKPEITTNASVSGNFDDKIAVSIAERAVAAAEAAANKIVGEDE